MRSHDRVEYFIGEPKCFRQFAERAIAGYWVVGHEYSVLYPDIPSPLYEVDPDATWLSLSDRAEKAAMPYLADGQYRVLKVEFLGRDPQRLGAYGNGLFRSGIFMERLIRASEIKGVDVRRGMPPNNSLERSSDR